MHVAVPDFSDDIARMPSSKNGVEKKKHTTNEERGAGGRELSNEQSEKYANTGKLASEGARESRAESNREVIADKSSYADEVVKPEGVASGAEAGSGQVNEQQQKAFKVVVW